MMETPLSGRQSPTTLRSTEDIPNSISSKPKISRKPVGSKARDRKGTPSPGASPYADNASVSLGSRKTPSDETEEEKAAYDYEHNMKFIVTNSPSEEKIVVAVNNDGQPEEKILVERPPQQRPEKFAVVPVPAEEKIAVNDPPPPHLHNGAPVHELGGDVDGARRESRDDSDRASFTSAARDLGVGMARLTGGTIKATAAGPSYCAKGMQKGLPTMYGNKAPREDPNVTGWKSGMTAAGSVRFVIFSLRTKLLAWPLTG